MLTMHAFATELPRGVVNFVSGSGRLTMPPIMRTGLVDVFAFIGNSHAHLKRTTYTTYTPPHPAPPCTGGSKAADALLKAHPAPHRLHSFMQLEGKNMGIVMGDAPLDVAVEQTLIGSTSYNGQRCTAIKLIMVHSSIADAFVSKFAAAVRSLKVGLPWEDGVSITPLPEPKKPAYLSELIADALSKGAKVRG